MKLCEYGCGQEAIYKQTNNKWCCCKFYSQCPEIRKKNTGNKNKKFSTQHRKRISQKLEGKNNPNYGKFGKENPFYGKHHNKTNKRKMAVNKYSIKKVKIKYPFFSQIEEMRYNPDKPKEKEIQVHCKNHLCENSKEKGGWFTPSRSQLAERIRQLEDKNGNGGSYFYCSEECKSICPLYNLKSDPFKLTEKPYNQEEYETFRQFVLERDNYKCQYCEKPATIVHHERPQKLEPLFVLDPDFAWSCCEECHYKYGHKTGTECSTGNLASKIC